MLVPSSGCWPLGDGLKDAHAISAEGTGAGDGTGANFAHAIEAGLVLDAADADDHHVLRHGVAIQQATEGGDVTQRERMQRRAGKAAQPIAGFVIQHGIERGVEQQAVTEGVGAGDEVDNAALAGLAGSRGLEGVDDHGELCGVRVGRQLDADLGHRFGSRHAAAIRRFGVTDGLEVLGQLGAVVGRGRRGRDVRARQVHLHGQAQVLVHLCGVGHERVRHGDLVGGARHGQDERLLGRRVRAQVALPDDLVDDPQVLGQRERRVAQRVERRHQFRRRVARFGRFPFRRVRRDRLAWREEGVLVHGVVVREPLQQRRADRHRACVWTVVERLDILECRGPRARRVEQRRVDLEFRAHLASLAERMCGLRDGV